MSDHIDNWHKLARYDTNIQGELHANLLKNNGINVSLQALSAIPGMNSGVVLWVQQQELSQARQILDSIDVVDINNADYDYIANSDVDIDNSNTDNTANSDDGE